MRFWNSGRKGAGSAAPARLACRAMGPARSPVSKLALALLLPVAAALLQWRLQPYLEPAAWLMFFPAVFLVAWVCGCASGLLATLVSVALGWWYFMPPAHVLHKDVNAWVSTGVFVGMGVLFSEFHRALRRSEQGLRASRMQYARLFELAPDAAFIADLAGRFVDVNAAYCRMLGYSPDEVLGRGIAEIVPAEDAAPLYQVLTLLRRDGKGHTEWRFLHHNGMVVPCEVSASILPDGTWQGLIRDISERRRLESQLQHSAHHDTLTGLSNRRHFEVVLQAALERARRQQRRLALLYVDLDRFKEVNDTLGHAAGDQLLREAAQRLVRCVRASDTVARLGGDEFAMVLEAIGAAADAGEVAHKIIAAVREPIDIEGHEVHVSASIGISIYPDDAQTIQGLTRKADLALYRAKDQGRDSFAFFLPEGAAAQSDAERPDPPGALPLRAGMRSGGRQARSPG